jgi:hypothetical protein
MKIHKEIVWNKGVNPKKDGKYLLAQFWDDGSLLTVSDIYYTVAHGWNTHSTDTEYGWGQNPKDGDYAWAELPF